MPSLFQRFKSLWQKPEPPVPPSPPPAAAKQAEPVRISVNVNAAPVEPSAPHVEFLNEELIYTVLRTCNDPEIPLNIVDLGLIYGVRIEHDTVHVAMTLTTQGCGMGGYISQDAQEKILSLPGVSEATVEIVWEPPWTPERISPAGRKTLGLPDSE
jgi:metal-sulfur cluster biosynthetic enzyme